MLDVRRRRGIRDLTLTEDRVTSGPGYNSLPVEYYILLLLLSMNRTYAAVGPMSHARFIKHKKKTTHTRGSHDYHYRHHHHH